MKTKNIILILSLAANIVLAIYGIVQQRTAERNLLLAMQNEKRAIEAVIQAEEAQRIAEEARERAIQERNLADSAAAKALDVRKNLK